MKKTWLFSLLLILTLVLSACGGAGTTDTVVPDDDLGTDIVPGDLTEEPADDMTTTPMVEPTMAGTDVGDIETTPAGTDIGTTIPETGAAVNDNFLLCVVMNYDVRDASGEDLGDVNDFVLDASGSRVQYVVLGAGGFLGIGEQNVLVPFDQLTIGSDDGDNLDDRVLIFNGDVDQLKNAPAFDLDAVDFNVDGWNTDFDGYWSGTVTTDTSVATPGAVTTDTSMATPGVATSEPAPQIRTDAAGTVVPLSTATVPSTNIGVTGDEDDDAIENANFVLASELCGAWVVDQTNFGSEDADMDDTNDTSADSTMVVPTNSVAITPVPVGTVTGGSAVTPAGTVTGDTVNETTVVSGDDMDGDFDRIGEVENVVIDPEMGIVTYLIIDPEDDFIADDVWVPTPFGSVRIVNNSDTSEAHDLLVVVDVDRFNTAPNINAEALPDLSINTWDDDYVDYWGITR